MKKLKNDVFEILILVVIKNNVVKYFLNKNYGEKIKKKLNVFLLR